MNLSFKDAQEIAIVALSIELKSGNLQGEPFDSALAKLRERYNIEDLEKDFLEG